MFRRYLLPRLVLVLYRACASTWRNTLIDSPEDAEDNILLPADD